MIASIYQIVTFYKIDLIFNNPARKTGELPPAAKVIKDMPEMSKFVYDFYYKVIEMLMKERKETEKQREAEETAAHRFQV